MTTSAGTSPLTWEQRRATRQARREKQRVANIGRAAKMHRDRLLWEATPHPGPPPIRKAPRPKMHVGCSGWFYWHWRDLFYPAGLPTTKWFQHYADRFNSVELNAPFYSWPTVANVRSWLRQAGRRKFVYTIKVSELITHVKRFKGTRALIRDFGFIADLLGDRMGCFLFQFPPSFRYTRARLEGILGQLDPARRNVVEFRHPSWWRDDVYDRFRETGTIFCSCSGPRLPASLIKTAEDVYVRFHGIKKWYRHNYSRAELAEWAARIRESGASRVWVYFNNDREGHAIRNARALLRLVSRKQTSASGHRQSASSRNMDAGVK
jgi:uncharacterized protein YecE (DUF72 family)